MSEQNNKQVLKSSSPKSSSKSSPKRTFAEVVSPVSTPVSKPKNVKAQVSSSSKRKRVEKFQGSSKGLSKFRKISKPVTTIHRRQFEENNVLVEVVEETVVEEFTDEVVATEPNASSDKLVTVREDKSYRPLEVQAFNDKVYEDLYHKFEAQSYEDHSKSQKIIQSLTQALNSIFSICSNAISSSTDVRDSIKKSTAPSLGELHKLCLTHQYESKVAAKKSSILADAMFNNMSIISEVTKNNNVSLSSPKNSSSATGRRVRFSEIDHFEPQSSSNYLKPKVNNKSYFMPKNVKPKVPDFDASSETLSNIEIELNNSFDTTTSFVDSAKKAQEITKMTESYNEFKRVSDFANLDDFEISDDSVTDNSEPRFTNSQLTEEEYEEFINEMTKAAMNDPKKYFNKKSFNEKK